jgi:Flp pilus assembly protein TadB
VGTIAAIGALLLLLAWFFWPSADARTPTRRADVDAAELEEAEREVQEAPDEHSVRDWGPGVQKPPS